MLFTSESSHFGPQNGEDIATGGGNDGVIPGLHSEWGYGNTVKFAVDYKHGTWARPILGVFFFCLLRAKMAKMLLQILKKR